MRTHHRSPLIPLVLIVAAWIGDAGIAAPPPIEAPPSPSRRAVALTFDDLPWVETAADLETILARTKELVGALSRNDVPAVGFVNESKLHVSGEMDKRIAALEMWLEAGFPLGNHTYSHPRFEDTPLEEFQDNVIRGEVITRRLMKERGFEGLYFRHPYTSTGPTKEAKDAFEAFQASRDYRIAPFTIEAVDYAFDKIFVRARQDGDTELAERIRAAYVDFNETAFEYFERRSQEVLGYEVKQILLLHANDINTACMDELIARLKARGYAFISLDEALEDPAYAIEDAYVGPWGISWLHRWTVSLDQPMNRREEPDPPKFILELYRQKR